MSKEARAYEKSLERMHDMKPDAFNPDYDERVVEAYEKHNQRVKAYDKKLDEDYDDLDDMDYDLLFNRNADKSYLKYLKECFLFYKEDKNLPKLEKYKMAAEDFKEKRGKRKSLQLLVDLDDDIEFPNYEEDGQNVWEDVVFKNELIGAKLTNTRRNSAHTDEDFVMEGKEEIMKIMEAGETYHTTFDAKYKYLLEGFNTYDSEDGEFFIKCSFNNLIDLVELHLHIKEKEKMFNLYELNLPTSWATAILYGDYSGMTDEDEVSLESFMKDFLDGKEEGHWGIEPGESFFMKNHDATNVLASDCFKYTYNENKKASLPIIKDKVISQKIDI